MRESTLTQGLAELIMAKPVTAGDLEQAALLTLDALANALAGRATEPGAILLRWAGASVSADAARRAFLLGALTHILETDDLHRASVVHPGCVVVPAAWAVAVQVLQIGQDGRYGGSGGHDPQDAKTVRAPGRAPGWAGRGWPAAATPLCGAEGHPPGPAAVHFGAAQCAPRSGMARKLLQRTAPWLPTAVKARPPARC